MHAHAHARSLTNAIEIGRAVSSLSTVSSTQSNRHMCAVSRRARDYGETVRETSKIRSRFLSAETKALINEINSHARSDSMACAVRV